MSRCRGVRAREDMGNRMGLGGVVLGSHSGRGQGSAFSVVSTYTGNVAAVLFEDRGHTMRCSFQYADTSGLTSMGGVGLCETSDGRTMIGIRRRCTIFRRGSISVVWSRAIYEYLERLSVAR